MENKIARLHVLKYIGGKGRMAGVLSRLIPGTCKVYAEMYCGSAALALNSGKFDVKILNDFNPHIANFWKVATAPETQGLLLERLQQTCYSWSLFQAAKERHEAYGAKQNDPIQWAADTYIIINQSFNADGRAWVYNDGTAYTKKMTGPLGLPLTFKSMSGQPFKVFNTDAVTCMKENQLLESPEVFIYLDPPYLEGLRCDGRLYQVDMPDVRDHITLLKAIQQAKAKIVLSGYWSGRDDGSDLYDWYLIPHGWHRHLLGEYVKGCDVSEGKSKGVEWVWCNYDLEKEAPGAIGFLESYCDDKKNPCISAIEALQSPSTRGGALSFNAPPFKEDYQITKIEEVLSMSKRANGEGSIRKRTDGRWLVTFPTGLYKENGKREYVYRYADTQAEAAEILRQLQAEKGMGVSQSKAAIKAGEWMNTWIEKHKSPKLAPATLTSYRNNFRIHIRPYIGDIVLRELSTYHIQRCLDAIGGSCSTFVKNYNIIHGSLEKAVELGMMVRNPCKGVTFPKDDTEDMRVLSKEEQQRFIEQLEGEYYRPMLLMYLYSGLRMGEGIPLTWDDIDLEKRTIRVNKKAIVCHDYTSHSAPQVVQDFCKTKSSKRMVVITAGLVEVLRVHKEEMIKRVEQSGEEWSESRLVFPNTRGNMVHNRNLQNSLYRIFAKCGIEGATMHTLRHTYATRCFEAGVDIKAISEQLGHANVKTTYNIYVHLLEDTKEKEIDKLEGIDRLLA